MHTRVSFSHICILIVAFRNDEVKKRYFIFNPSVTVSLQALFVYHILTCIVISHKNVLYFHWYSWAINFKDFEKFTVLRICIFLEVVSIKSTFTILCLIILFCWSTQQQNPIIIRKQVFIEYWWTVCSKSSVYSICCNFRYLSKENEI